MRRPATLHAARELAAVYVLPARVAIFILRARRLARQIGDAWGPDAAARPRELAHLLALARGRSEVVELGTAVGWTAIALALADRRRRVTSVDAVVHEQRARYLELVPGHVHERIDFVEADAALAATSSADGDPAPAGVDLLFIDAGHRREQTIAEFQAWQPRLAAGAVVAFHDYRHPEHDGVAEAIEELGLEGEVAGGMFVWRQPRTCVSG